MRIIVIEPTKAPAIRNVKSFAEVKKIIGGYIELIALTQDVHSYINEDGKALGLTINAFATKLAEISCGLFPGDCIVGPMVILGSLNAKGEMDGEEHDVPQDVCDAILRLNPLAV